MEESHFSKQVVTLSRSLVISEGSVMWKVILVPKGSMAPPDFTSLVQWLQFLQLVAMMITSLKWGISGRWN